MGWFTYRREHAEQLPVVVTAIENYGRVYRLLKANVPVTIEMDVETEFTGDHEHGFDTIAEIPGTDPKQYMTNYVEFTDRALPAIQDPIQKSDPRIVFCVAWARGGYLPTHNPNYRLPQGKDPVWNNANCRNRRIFNDRTVKKVAANTKPFLLQTYRRDMGGGNFVLMKDVSSPILVRGRHWGAFRMGFRQS